MREIPEWVGSSDNAKVPPRVRARVFERHGGVCYLSGRKITPADKWELEHIVALCNGGRHAESNLAPALAEPHKAKTAADRKQKAKRDRIHKRHIGIQKPRTITRWRRFNGEPVIAPRER